MKRISISLLVAFFAVLVLVSSSIAQQASPTSSLEPVITSYLQVQHSLAIDRRDSVRLYAAALKMHLAAVSADSLPPAAKAAWNKNSTSLSAQAAALAKSTTLSAQRKAFAELSVYIYKMLKEAQITTDDLYYQYCPMADAYWLSDKADIENPYYGKQMSSCGSTSDTLHASIGK